MKGLFDGPTTTVPAGHLVVYALKDLAEQLHPVGAHRHWPYDWPGELRRAAREHTGLPLSERRRLLGETATGTIAGGVTDDELLPNEDLVEPPVEPHNFNPKGVHPERSPVTPQVTSHEAPRDAPRRRTRG